MADNGIKISEMTAAGNLDGSQIFPVVRSGTNLKTTASDMQTYLNGTGAAKRNAEPPRFKNLGSSLTSAQNAAISNKTFEDLYLGDYWSSNGRTWRIWHFYDSYPFGDNSTGIGKPCLVILPDEPDFKADGKATKYWNDTDTTDGGYENCKFRTTYRSQCDIQFTNVFGTSHLLTHREILCNAVKGDKPSGWEWCDCASELPSEAMVYGSRVCGIQENNGYSVGTAWGQLALAAVAPELVVRSNYSWWLRDVCSASAVAYVGINGAANWTGASAAWLCVRSFRLLCAA